MGLIPVPELVIGAVVALVVLVLRTLWRFSHAPIARQSSAAGQLGQEAPDTQRKRAQLIASCAVLAMISMPLILRIVPPNGVYGFRTGATQSNPEIWYRTNAFMGWALLLAGVISAAGLLAFPAGAKRWLLWLTFLLPLLGALVSSFVYVGRLI